MKISNGNRVKPNQLILDVLVMLIFLSIFVKINFVIHFGVFCLMLCFVGAHLKLKEVGYILLWDLFIIGLYIYAGNFTNDFWSPIANVTKFYYLSQAYFMFLIINKKPECERKHYVKLASNSLIITMIISIGYNLFIDPTAIRFRPEEYNFICNFGQYYAVLFLLTTLIFAYLNHKRPNRRMFVLESIIIAVFFIIGNLVTGLVLATISVVIVVLVNYFKKRLTIVPIAGLLGGILYLFRFFIVDIVNAFSNLSVFNEITKTKLKAIGNYITGVGYVDTLSGRSELTNRSMNSFRKHPFFGVGYSGYEVHTVGCHQEWSDLLAVFGLIGTIIFCIILLKILFNVYRKCHTELDKKSFFVACVMLILLGFFNPCLMEATLGAMFIICPNASLYGRRES